MAAGCRQDGERSRIGLPYPFSVPWAPQTALPGHQLGRTWTLWRSADRHRDHGLGRGSPDPPARPTAWPLRAIRMTIRHRTKRVWRPAPLTSVVPHPASAVVTLPLRGEERGPNDPRVVTQLGADDLQLSPGNHQ